MTTPDQALIEVQQQLDYNPDFSLFDVTNPYSLINMVPTKLAPLLHQLKTKMPKMHNMTEAAIRKAAEVTDRDDRVRIAFWDEYDRATTTRQKMSLGRILTGNIPLETWMSVYERQPMKLLFIITPIKSYATAMKAILDRGVNRLQEIINLPFHDKDGKLDTRVISQVLKAIQLVDMRVKGAIIQKVQIQQQTMQMNANVSSEALKELSINDLERLSRQLDKISNTQLPPAMEAEIQAYERKEELLHEGLPTLE